MLTVQINLYMKMDDKRKELQLSQLELFVLSVLRRKGQTEEQATKYRKKNVGTKTVRGTAGERRSMFPSRNGRRKVIHVLVKDLRLLLAEYFYKTFRMTVKQDGELRTWGGSDQASKRSP